MRFLYEKQSRRFCLAVLILIFLVGIGSVLQSRIYGARIQSMMIEHDTAVISSLLEQGVETDIIAAAITNDSSTEQGSELLNKLGISEATDPRILENINDVQSLMATAGLVETAVLAVLLFLVIFSFLIKRDRLYRSAVGTVINFTDGDFSSLLPQQDNGTVYQLFSRINAMATALKAKQETETEAREFLKGTVSDISHQLKTPLAALSMYQEIIQNEPDNTETVKTFSQKSTAALGRIEHLIKTLLKLTRLDAGGIEFHKSEYMIGEVVSQSVEELSDRAKNENKELKISGNEKDIIRCDMEWTREAVGNIVKNALDHTKAGGMIQISWDETPLMFRISVSDNGDGIDEEDIHHIFKRFYRSKKSLDTQGIGLGLPLAKSIVEGQGGTISVQSEIGAGTTFVLSFPR